MKRRTITMMAKHISSWVVILLVLCLFVVAHAKDMPNKEMKKIQEAAQEGIQSFLRDADPQVSYQIGFSNREEIDNAKIGKGFQVFTLSKDELLSDSSKKADLYSLTFPTDMWIFPIVSNNKAISTVIVDRMDNSWVPVSFGESGLAKQLGSLMETWPVSDGYEFRLIRVYEITSDLIEISRHKTIVGVIPLISGRVAMGLKDQSLNPMDVYNSIEIVSKIRSIIRESPPVE